MAYPIADIRAISPFYLAKLKAARIRSTTSLLERTSTPRLRKRLSDETGIPQQYILDWANVADLTRVQGIALDYAELLKAAGVDTVRDLQRRNVRNLVSRMTEINEEKKLVDFLPGEKRVLRWIEAAKSLHAMMEY